MKETIDFRAEAVRTLPSPSQPAVTTYFAYVNFKDLPNLDDYLEVNPRKPKMTTNIAKQLIEAVESSDDDFDINSRGMVIIAKSFTFDTKKMIIQLDFDKNNKLYGLLDGGHTYTAIRDHYKNIPSDLDKFVRLEIIVGPTLTASRISDARNTSAQVSDIALYELDNKFGFIKDSIANEDYSDDIAYKDNDSQRLPVSELLKLLYAYNVYKYPDGKSAPVQAYSSKAMVFKDIKSDIDANNGSSLKYKNLSVLLPTLVELYDRIELELRDKYLEVVEKGRFGSLRGVECKDGKIYKTFFLQNETEYKIANGYILPIFGAFRALVNIDTLKWDVNPFDVWDEVGGMLLKNTLDSKNPQDAGKRVNIWTNNYQIVQSKKQEIQYEKLLKEFKSLKQ